MGKRTPIRPCYTTSLAKLIESGTRVQACCEKCREWKELDLVALAGIKGADYDLWGRRTRCRIFRAFSGSVAADRDTRSTVWPLACAR